MRKKTKETGYTFKQFQSMTSGKVHPIYCYTATKKGITKIEELNSKNSKFIDPQNNDIVLDSKVILNREYVRQFFGDIKIEDECNKVLIVLIKQIEKDKKLIEFKE